ISQMMIFVKAFTNTPARPVSALRTLLILLNPFALHLTSELWEILSGNFPGASGAITDQSWPEYDEKFLIEDEIEIVLQVNGKVRDRIVLNKAASNSEVEAAALANGKVAEQIAGKTVRKVIVVPQKLVNVVAN